MNLIKDYYRKITESLPQGDHLTNYSLLFLSILISFSTILAGITYAAVVKGNEVRHEFLEKLTYWRTVAEERPDSPDALFEAGYYALKLGDATLAQNYLNGALRLDPSFKKAKLLQEQIVP